MYVYIYYIDSDVRAWEKRSGKLWSDLTHEERAEANEDIAEAKKKKKRTAAAAER